MRQRRFRESLLKYVGGSRIQNGTLSSRKDLEFVWLLTALTKHVSPNQTSQRQQRTCQTRLSFVVAYLILFCRSMCSKCSNNYAQPNPLKSLPWDLDTAIMSRL